MADETRRERVVLETERYRISGEVTLPAEGFRGRLSDLLNREGLGFISLANAVISDHDGGSVQKRPFVAVARHHVQVAYEES